MKELALALQLISYLPAIQSRPPDPPAAAVAGSGLLLIAACQEGQEIEVRPGTLSGMADKDGVARIKAPAQAEHADSYVFYVNGRAVTFNGTLSSGESLSAVCP